MRLNGLVPARFLTVIAHLVITVVILWSPEDNVKACLPVSYTEDQFQFKRTQLLIGLGVALGLMALELLGFLMGLSMFMPYQALLSTAVHTAACVTLAFFLFDQWECDTYWYVFGFCSALPAVTEIIVMIGVMAFRKGI